MSAFNDLLTQHIGASFMRQFALADFLGKRNWNVDMDSGVVTFGRDLTYPIQLLGTESDGDNTWLWAWGNADSQLPANLLGACNRLRDFGREKNVPEFTDRSFSLDLVDGHSLGLVASGMCGNCCYYRGPYEGGALFFLVNGVPDTVLSSSHSERVVTVITKVISEYTVNHRKMAESFLQSQGFTLETSGNTLCGSRGEDSIKLSFDAQGRISNIGGTVHPRQQATKRWWQFWKA